MKIELIISTYKTNSYKTNSDSASPPNIDTLTFNEVH